jgi:hypothetical protein
MSKSALDQFTRCTALGKYYFYDLTQPLVYAYPYTVIACHRILAFIPCRHQKFENGDEKVTSTILLKRHIVIIHFDTVQKNIESKYVIEYRRHGNNSILKWSSGCRMFDYFIIKDESNSSILHISILRPKRYTKYTCILKKSVHQNWVIFCFTIQTVNILTSCAKLRWRHFIA